MTSYVFPGQGSQKLGMGSTLFDEFRQLELKASAILGYSVEQLCLQGPISQLNQTQYTQPCLFFVNALHYLKYLKEGGQQPQYLAGHSLGEYNALFAAGAFDLETGLRLVQKRGELMSQAKNGAMAAVIGMDAQQVRQTLEQLSVTTLDVANFNSPTQTVISGIAEDINKVAEDFRCITNVKYVILPVSAAFHSRYMQNAAEAFSQFLKGFAFSSLKIPVIANVTARPYDGSNTTAISNLLSQQICSQVNWNDSVRYLMGKGESQFIEIGPGKVLNKLIEQIRKDQTPLIIDNTPAPVIAAEPVMAAEPTSAKSFSALHLGADSFKLDYGLKYAYVAGSMYKGIASANMVIAMGKAKLLGFLGTGGMKIEQVQSDLNQIQGALTNGESYGVNLLSNLDQPEMEEQLVALYIRQGVKILEASAFMQMTPALVWFRLKGAKRLANGQVVAAHSIIAKVSRPEVAQQFMSPAPLALVNALKQKGLLSEQEAACQPYLPVSTDICVEADSGGHTDKGTIFALLPAIQYLRERLMSQFHYTKAIRIGAAGGIGTPQAAVAAFMLGAEFILTGSINQCTVEAGTSDEVKALLQSANVQDTTYAPSGDMFELGAQIQVLKKGLFFPARANKLYDLYRQYDAIEALNPKIREQIENKYFKRSFAQVWQETATYYRQANPDELAKAEKNPKAKMALIFRWYFVHTARLALQGSRDQKVDYQVHCGPALGAFNQWVQGTELENWQNRRVDLIGELLMQQTASLLSNRFEQLFN